MDAVRSDPICPVAPEPRLWTADEYLKMAELGIFGEDTEGLELLEGQIVLKMSPISIRHAECVNRITRWLNCILPSNLDMFSLATARMSLRSVPDPDVAVLRKPIEEFDTYPNASEISLVIEVSDSSLRVDRNQKAKIYDSAGIQEYWIANLRDRALEVHREPTTDGYGFIKRYPETATVSPLFADVEVTVTELLPKKKASA